MAGTDDKAMTSPTFCKNGCGFYGSPNTEGMCSKCFRDLRKEENNVQSALAAMGANGSSTNSAPQIITPSSSSTSGGTINPKSSSDCERLRGQPESTVEEMSCSPPSSSVTDAFAGPSPSGINLPSTEDALSGGNLSSSASSADPSTSQPNKTSKLRCAICKKKLGLTGMSCRCGGLYCSLHRYPNDHQCSFDYKTEGQNAIRKANPKVDGEKIAKI